MVKRRFFLVLVLGAFATSLHAEPQQQNLEDIRSAVHKSATEHLIAIYGEERTSRDVSLRVSQLDPRLRLSQCDTQLDTEIRENTYGVKHLNVKVHCATGARWTIYVSVAVNMYNYIAVATRNLHRGEVIQEGDFMMKRSNTSDIGGSYLDSASYVLGKEVKRAIRASSVLKKQDLKAAALIRKGEMVVVVARSGALEVRSEATALSEGALGQQIKVQNHKSKRIVDARVSGRGKAEVTL